MVCNVKYFEMHLTHTCNLNCDYCSHYCNVGYPGHVDIETGKEWLSAWAKRIAPTQIRLLGGEPLLHPDIGEYIVFVNDVFPKAKRTIVTNGILLEAKKDILPLMVATGTRINISLHPVPREMEGNLHAALSLIDKWERKGLIATIQPSHSNWFFPYSMREGQIIPFCDNDPEKSFACMCGTPEKRCITLHEGAMWACPNIAYVHNIIDKLPNRSVWEKYLDYKPLPVAATDDEIRRFFFAHDDMGFCDICPSILQKIDVNDLLENGKKVIVHDGNSKRRKRRRALSKARQFIKDMLRAARNRENREKV